MSGLMPATFVTCGGCGAGWRFPANIAAVRCPDCARLFSDDWCEIDCGCTFPREHEGPCNLTGPLPKDGCRCQACNAPPSDYWENVAATP